MAQQLLPTSIDIPRVSYDSSQQEWKQAKDEAITTILHHIIEQ